MKILLLHLSDLHFKGINDPLMQRVKPIAATAIARIHSANAVFIVGSGDIAYSGKRSEYEAASSFFSQLRDELSKETDAPIHFIFTPGNHDCDFSGDQSIRDILIDRIVKDGSSSLTQAIKTQCLSVQENFQEFRRSWEPAEKSFDDSLWTTYDFNIQGYKMTFECKRSINRVLPPPG